MQLRKLVETGVSQDEMDQILGQLRTLVRPTSASPAPPPAIPPTKYTSALPYPSSFTYNQTVVPAGAPLHPQYPPPHAPTYSNSAQQFQISDTSRPAAIGPIIATTAPPAIPNITGLFEALVKAGVVSATSTPTGAGATAHVQDDIQSQATDVPGPSESKVEDTRAYKKAILAEDVKFSSADISRYSTHTVCECPWAHFCGRHRPNIVYFLYDRMPVQCKQCGLRFSDAAQAKRAMQEHLDMHFRQNRKASQSVGRGHSRSWFLCAEVSNPTVFYGLCLIELCVGLDP
jgi:pre-mRNA cleavage complex 2 protein Pcf11